MSIATRKHVKEHPFIPDDIAYYHTAYMRICNTFYAAVPSYGGPWVAGPQARAVNAIYSLFLISWFLTVGALTVRYICDDKCNLAMQPHHLFTVVALLVLSGNFTFAALESNAYMLAKSDLFILPGLTINTCMSVMNTSSKWRHVGGVIWLLQIINRHIHAAFILMS